MIRSAPEGFGAYEVDWDSNPPKLTRVSRPPDYTLVPGFVDIHIHGAYGIDFMSASKAEMHDLCESLVSQGYEMFLPTTVTASLSDVKAALSNIPEHPLVGGFHLEGPFLSPKHPGAQPPEHILTPAEKAEEWGDVLEDERLKVITMAPEIPGALALVTKLSLRTASSSAWGTRTPRTTRHGQDLSLGPRTRPTLTTRCVDFITAKPARSAMHL